MAKRNENESGPLDELDALLARLEPRLREASGVADVIDDILSSPPRETAVRSLRDHEAVRRFREEVRRERLRLETVTTVLRLLRTALEAYLR